MSILNNILQQKHCHLTHSGMASRCRLALQCLQDGSSSVLLVRNREEFAAARGLLTLFSPELSQKIPTITTARWESPLLFLPPGALHTGHGSAWTERMATLYALQYAKACCLVLTVDNLLIKYMPRKFFAEHEIVLSVGMEMSPDILIEQAISWGFERVQMVTRPGDLSRRGDILDVFPPGYEKPIRIEFFGDLLEEMRMFDQSSQRSLENIAEITLIPPVPIAAGNIWHDKAIERWERMLHKNLLDENSVHDFKKDLRQGGYNLLPGTFYDAPTILEEWLDKDVTWLLPGKVDIKEEVERSLRTLGEGIEAEDMPVAQPKRLVLRETENILAMWDNSSVVYEEPMVMGAGTFTGQTFELKERQIRDFSSLFPKVGAQDRPWQHLVAGIKEWQRSKRQVLLSFSSERSRAKFLALAEQDGLVPHLRYMPQAQGLFALIAPWRSGIELLWDNVLILGEDIIYPKAEKVARTAAGAFRGLSNFNDINVGDLLVHRDYGIARYVGLFRMEVGDAANDFLLLEYSGADKLYVPADRLGLVQLFKGGDAEPPLDKLGGGNWQSSKEKARKAIEQIAADLVEMYAFRKVAKGFQYNAPDELYAEFEATFGFEETPDQAKAIQDVLDDMEKPQPMDRLVCGDVGFGKTEVALRAAFRAAAEGRQVALLCPTTVLAEQHFQTFRQRLAGFPVNVGLLSRFVTKQKQKETLHAAALGQLDILIGTHRLLSKDVTLPNLGLLILDEEQRFGVRHKEKLKAMKKNVDALTLTATPIPRTLQLSMSGIRDLSIIETAPPERKPVETAILQRDGAILKQVLEREIAREGQVFWVYNRVQGLERTVEYVRNLVPSARIGMAHGQMAEKQLEETMHGFWHGTLDVLVCTSIVESGLDFPRANTLIVDQAHMFGLGQLYQLRGRVGRSHRQAYAYFVVPEEHRLSDIARERMRIILDLDYLGAGFQVAMEDLRLRGAGNILGEVQSGHMTRLGLDLFLEMLEQAVNRLKGTDVVVSHEVELNIGIMAHIPENYIQDGRERLRYYKALSSAVDSAAREDLALAMRDRFGVFSTEFKNFLAVLDLKQKLSTLEVRRADIFNNKITVHWDKDQSIIDIAKVMYYISKKDNLRLIPPASIEVKFEQHSPEQLAQKLVDIGDFLCTLKLESTNSEQ